MIQLFLSPLYKKKPVCIVTNPEELTVVLGWYLCYAKATSESSLVYHAPEHSHLQLLHLEY